VSQSTLAGRGRLTCPQNPAKEKVNIESSLIAASLNIHTVEARVARYQRKFKLRQSTRICTVPSPPPHGHP